MTERQALVALYSYIYFGPARTKLLIDYFGSAQKSWAASEKKLLDIGLKNERVKDFVKYKTTFDTKAYFEKLKRLNIDFIIYDDSDFPKNLRDLSNAPLVLYKKGNLSENSENAVAVVGTRKMTSYGREVTQQFTQELASMGITIISGLARGVDTMAHRATLDAGGQTIAVLACGLDQVYPLENTQLAKKILEKDGALLSEYPLKHPALRANFASRNRILRALSIQRLRVNLLMVLDIDS